MSLYPLHSILFLDIETVSQYAAFEELPDAGKELWRHKADLLIKDKDTTRPEGIYDRAAIYAEFGKIVCISCGYIQGMGPDKKISLKSFYGDDERTILLQFCEMLEKWTVGNRCLCAHNGKEFDFPYLCRRMIIQGIEIPGLLRIAGKKPWDIPHIDTLEYWKFGDYRSYTSLSLLAYVLGIPTPKDDIDGSQVGKVYWLEHDLQRIATYCQKDVITVAQVYLRLQGEVLIKPENIVFR
ncbi:MAG: 3'-5' exonuclease [Puia sp.]|nr:3'-5' exonuclease [Puia sp.]